MYGIITEYMGTAFTGLGTAHKYDHLIEHSTTTIFLKCPPTNTVATILNEVALYFVKRGYDVDKFMSPTQLDKADAIYIRSLQLLLVQASKPVALEPTKLGAGHQVISFYDMYNETQLRAKNTEVAQLVTKADNALKKSLACLKEAKVIHDDWEKINIERMMWQKHKNLIAEMKNTLFDTIYLNKSSAISHRLIGSLTSSGAADFIPSITKKMNKRYLIKGLPGTGKSTFMRALGKEGERRGFDVLYGWCGLDPEGVDLVLFPELAVCFFDATKPHNYEIEKRGDEVIDFVSLCAQIENDTQIEEVQQAYEEKIKDATGYMQAYAQADNNVKLLMDTAVFGDVLEEKSNKVYEIARDVLARL